ALQELLQRRIRPVAKPDLGCVLAVFLALQNTGSLQGNQSSVLPPSTKVEQLCNLIVRHCHGIAVTDTTAAVEIKSHDQLIFAPSCPRKYPNKPWHWTPDKAPSASPPFSFLFFSSPQFERITLAINKKIAHVLLPLIGSSCSALTHRK